VKKAQNSMWALWCDVGPETQGGSLALRCYHQAVRHFRILVMVAWLSNGQRETKQGPKVGLLRGNGSHAHYSHQCCESTYLPPPAGLGDPE